MLELGFKLEMMLEMSFLLVGGKKNDLEELFSMYSEKYLCEYFTLAVIFSAIEANWLLKIFAISTGFVAVLLLSPRNTGRNIF